MYFRKLQPPVRSLLESISLILYKILSYDITSVDRYCLRKRVEGGSF